MGDVGLVAENSRSTQRLMLPPPALTASGVIAKFRDIARLTGSAVSGAGRLSPGPQTLCSSPWDPEPCLWCQGCWVDCLGLDHFSSVRGAELPVLPTRLQEPPI